MHREIPFEPYSLLHKPFHQTVLGVAFHFCREPPSKQKIISLPDGDKLSLEISKPDAWQDGDPIVVLVHGLCGSHKSPNPQRMAKQLYEIGIQSVRFNMRGCGSGRGLAKGIFHAGKSDDLFAAVKVIRKENPRSPITLIGFSLGGNVVLKLAAELGSLAEPFFQQVIAASPPIDIYQSVRMFQEPENQFFERYFYKALRRDVYYRHKKFKDLPRVELPRFLKIYEFDQIYTAPMGGFKSVEDYYNKCSSIHIIENVGVPCKVLLAEDDPIISPKSFDGILLPDCMEIYKTKKGGHLGYLGRPRSGRGLHWLDSLLIEWITGK